MSLVQAVDYVLEFVGVRDEEGRHEMTRGQVDQLEELAAHVFRLAVPFGLDRLLPRVHELRPGLESGDLPPVQFETKVNLPGDWDAVRRPVRDIADLRHHNGLLVLPEEELECLPPTCHWAADEEEPAERVYLVMATPRWYRDMLSLREAANDAEVLARLAQSGNQNKQTTSASRRKDRVSPDSRALLVFLEHPDWTKTEIAKHLGQTVQSIARGRCPRLDAAMKAYKQGKKPASGSKSRDGDMEVFGDDNE